jgi:hypothetical protein
MSYQVSCYGGVLTIRLDGRVQASQLVQDIHEKIASQTTPVTVILDTTLSTCFDQVLKSMLYRTLQNHLITRIGVCGINERVKHDVMNFVLALSRVRSVSVKETEADLRADFGLSSPQQKKLTGMLTYLKKP